ncbi:hypothetical protein AALA22_15370 [Anaerovoracaceae bacterium 41-7]
MISLTVTNGASGLGKTSVVDENLTVNNIIDDPEYANYLVGQQIMFNGAFIVGSDLNKPLRDIGCNMDGRNVLSSIKPAAGAL